MDRSDLCPRCGLWIPQNVGLDPFGKRCSQCGFPFSMTEIDDNRWSDEILLGFIYSVLFLLIVVQIIINQL